MLLVIKMALVVMLTLKMAYYSKGDHLLVLGKRGLLASNMDIKLLGKLKQVLLVL